MQNTAFLINKTLNLKGRIVDLSHPRVMGILNVTPDSFYDGKRYTTDKEILDQAEKMLTEGATFLDIGGYSSRPGAADVSEEEERKRALHAVTLVHQKFPEAFISIDTFRSTVAREAVNAGACMINDISGGALDSQMFETVAKLNVPYVLMHMRGNPRTMMEMNDYANVVKDVIDYFHERVNALRLLGVTDIIIDPGFGFAKKIDQSFELLQKLEQLKIVGRPMLCGLSRKSMIWKTLEVTPAEALTGTTTLNTIALLKGASILRVHDVKEAMQVIKLVGRLPA